MVLTSWPVRVFNLTPHEVECIVFTTIPLSRGTLFHGAVNQRELTVVGNGRPDGDWVQYWPLMMESADYPWMWRDDSLRLLRVAFPVRLPAGVAKASRGGNLDYEHFSQLVATIQLQTHPTGNTFEPHPEVEAGMQSSNAQFFFHAQPNPAWLSPLIGVDHNGQAVPRRFIQQPYGPNQNLAWVRTWVTQTRTIPVNWRIQPSMWAEGFWQQHDRKVASGRTLDVHLTAGLSRVTADNTDALPDSSPLKRRDQSNLIDITGPMYWQVNGPTEVHPEQSVERMFMPRWPGTQSARRVVGASTELMVFDHLDWQNVGLGLSALQDQQNRTRMSEATSLPIRTMMRYAQTAPTALEASTYQAMVTCAPLPLHTKWRESQDFGLWGMVHDQSINRRAVNDVDAWEKACNHANRVYEIEAIGSDIAARFGGRHRRDAFAAPVCGQNEHAQIGGEFRGFGFHKCVVHVTPNMGNPDLRAWKLDALGHSRFPYEWRRPDGTRYSPKDWINDALYPGLGTAIVHLENGTPRAVHTRTSWAVSLGAHEGAGGAGVWSYSTDGNRTAWFNGFSGKYNQYADGINMPHVHTATFCQYLWLTGDPFTLWWVENLKNFVLTSGAWRDLTPSRGINYFAGISEDAYKSLMARAEGRLAVAQAYVHVFGGDRHQDDILYERVVDSLLPNLYGNPAVNAAAGVPTEIPDALHEGEILGIPPDPSRPPNNPGPYRTPDDRSFSSNQLTLKSQGLRALGRVYAEDAARSASTSRTRALHSISLSIADTVDAFVARNGITHNRYPRPFEVAESQSVHLALIWITASREINYGPGLVFGNPNGWGKRMTAAQMTWSDPPPNHYSNGLDGGGSLLANRLANIPNGNNLVWCAWMLASHQWTIARGLGTASDQSVASTILTHQFEDLITYDPDLRDGGSVYSDPVEKAIWRGYGWGNPESATGQLWTWFTHPVLIPTFDPNVLVLPPLRSKGRSSGIARFGIGRPLQSRGRSAGKIAYTIASAPTAIVRPLMSRGTSGGDAKVEVRFKVELELKSNGRSTGQTALMVVDPAAITFKPHTKGRSAGGLLPRLGFAPRPGGGFYGPAIIIPPVEKRPRTKGRTAGKLSLLVAPPGARVISVKSKGRSAGAIATELLDRFLARELVSRSRSGGTMQIVVGPSGYGIATELQRIFYEHHCDPSRLGVEADYYQDGERRRIRCKVFPMPLEGGGETLAVVQRIRVKIARHPMSLMRCQPGRDTVALQFQPGAQVEIGRVTRLIEEREAFYMVEVQR